jgi:hypothetical protein
MAEVADATMTNDGDGNDSEDTASEVTLEVGLHHSLPGVSGWLHGGVDAG